MNTRDDIYLDYRKSLILLDFLINLQYPMQIDFKKNRLVIYDENEQVMLQFKYPLCLNLTENVIKDKNFSNIFGDKDCIFYVLLIQTGNAAIGLFKNEKALEHKVIRKYMTRQKQGKSQLNYLKTKGKSRTGSRIRLANAVSFFEEINEKTNTWMKAYPSKTIIYSCTPMLWGMLFQSKINPPFEKKDYRLKKVPLDLAKPNFEILQNVVRYSLKGYLNFSEGCGFRLQNNIEKLIHSPIN